MKSAESADGVIDFAKARENMKIMMQQGQQPQGAPQEQGRPVMGPAGQPAPAEQRSAFGSKFDQYKGLSAKEKKVAAKPVDDEEIQRLAMFKSQGGELTSKQRATLDEWYKKQMQ